MVYLTSTTIVLSLIFLIVVSALFCYYRNYNAAKFIVKHRAEIAEALSERGLWLHALYVPSGPPLWYSITPIGGKAEYYIRDYKMKQLLADIKHDKICTVPDMRKLGGVRKVSEWESL